MNVQKLQSEQDLLKSTCETLREDKKKLESRIREQEEKCIRADIEVRRWVDNYRDQSKLIYMYETQQMNFQSRYEDADRGRVKAEGLLEELQRERADHTSKKRKFAALLESCGFTRDDFDAATQQPPEVDANAIAGEDVVVVDH